MSSKINIVHLYPQEMNIYGDNGNILVLVKRLEWQGLKANIINIGIGDKLPNNTHLIIGGGGQDAGQQLIAKDLQTKANTIAQMSRDGVPMLMICGMYQMFGHYFKTQSGETIKGIGLLDAYTVAGAGRLIGNITTQSQWGELVGYENHSGKTYLQAACEPLGITVEPQQGNNGQDKTEGAIVNHTYGSYLHGPLLAKAPEFADNILSQSLKIAGYSKSLSNLDDRLERQAAAIAKKRPR